MQTVLKKYSYILYTLHLSLWVATPNGVFIYNLHNRDALNHHLIAHSVVYEWFSESISIVCYRKPTNFIKSKIPY